MLKIEGAGVKCKCRFNIPINRTPLNWSGYSAGQQIQAPEGAYLHGAYLVGEDQEAIFLLVPEAAEIVELAKLSAEYCSLMAFAEAVDDKADQQALG